ncbi:hypothetical protein, partial [Archangium violaceum]|uniref:hypothetical protein n=1 Tax=Archangium violaceum TaxID=83451 RepID=UPI001269FBEA
MVLTKGQSPAEQYLSAYLTHAEVRGRPYSAQALREMLASFSWEKTFFQLAAIAGSLANFQLDQGSSLVRLTHDSLRRLKLHPNQQMWSIGEFVDKNPDRPLIHEQCIYFLQAMAILEGRPDGPAPSDLHMAFMLLAANDHLSFWRDADKPPLPNLELVTAELCHVARFNRYPDPLRRMVRTAMIFERQPPQGLFADAKNWEMLQQRAFGCSFTDYFDTFVVPLFMASQQWGASTKSGAYEGPMLNPEQWLSKTNLPHDWATGFLQELSITREEARKQLKASLRNNGLPHAPVIFIRKPFLKTDSGHLIAASPWAVQEQLRGGLWMRFMRASEKFSKKQETWTSTFGHLFEMACREVAQEGSKEHGFSEQVELSKAPGSADELEDV